MCVWREEWAGSPEHVCGQTSVSSLQEGPKQRFALSALKDTSCSEPAESSGNEAAGELATLSMALRAVG